MVKIQSKGGSFYALPHVPGGTGIRSLEKWELKRRGRRLGPLDLVRACT